MKKIKIFVVLLLLLTVVGCGKKEEEKPKENLDGNFNSGNVEIVADKNHIKSFNIFKGDFGSFRLGTEMKLGELKKNPVIKLAQEEGILWGIYDANASYDDFGYSAKRIPEGTTAKRENVYYLRVKFKLEPGYTIQMDINDLEYVKKNFLLDGKEPFSFGMPNNIGNDYYFLYYGYEVI